MFPFLKKFFTDIDTFQSWTRVAWVSIKAALLTTAICLGTGVVHWPENLPKWMYDYVIPAFTFVSVIIQFGQRNRPAAEVKQLVRDVVREEVNPASPPLSGAPRP